MINRRRAFAITAALVCCSFACADEITLLPSKDNSLYEDPLGSFSNGAGIHLFAGKTLAPAIRRAVMAFDLSSIPPGSTINSAALTLHVFQSAPIGPPSANGKLYRLTSNWGEGTSDAGMDGGIGTTPEPGDATWLHTFYPAAIWNTPGGDFVNTSSASANVGVTGSVVTWASPEMAADAQGWIGNPASNFGWILRIDEDHPGTARRFESHNNPDAATLGPRLTINYTRPCAGDFNHDGSKTVSDIFAMLTAWFQHELRADVDGTAGWTVSDIFAFLAIWFRPC